MNFYLLLLILGSILLSSIAQVTLKVGMSSPNILSALQSTETLQTIKAIASNLYVVGGLGLYFASAAVWLLVLAKVDVSFAYPFVGLGFIITMLLAFFINGEVLTATKVAGTLLIALGVIVIAQG